VPTYAEYKAFQVGAFVSPLTSSTANSLLADADPALYGLIDYYQAVLLIHLGARFDAEVAGAGLVLNAGAISAVAVPYDPAHNLQEQQLVPPLLAVFVESEKTDDKTRQRYHLEAKVKVQWVLPPLSPAQYLKLYPMLRAVAKVLVDRSVQGFDPSYESAEAVFAASGIEQLDLDTIDYGHLQIGNLFFPCVELGLTVYECKMDTPAQPALAGVDTEVDDADDEGSEAVVETGQDF
jgi:hypothetical protein